MISPIMYNHYQTGFQHLGCPDNCTLSMVDNCLCGCGQTYCTIHSSSNLWLNEEHERDWWRKFQQEKGLIKGQWFDTPVDSVVFDQEILDLVNETNFE